MSAQITTHKVVEAAASTENMPYDSTLNFLGENVHQYIGQLLYVNGKPESLREFGYRGFLTNYTSRTYDLKSNVYECCDSYNSQYNRLVDRYFLVLDVIPHPRANEDDYLYGDKYYLKLEANDNKDIVYFEYDTGYEVTFPFVVAGYFVKKKRELVGDSYVLTNKNSYDLGEPILDINTGKHIIIQADMVWKAIDVSIEEKYFSLALILENETGGTIGFNILELDDLAYIIEKSTAYHLQTKFGEENWDLILEGQVRLGMTDEMCRISWGEPEDINRTIGSMGVQEQWVYSSQYLYFENGKLTTIQ